MSKFQNSRAEKFKNQLPDTLLDNSNIEQKMKFNFHYFTHGKNAGQNFEEWNEQPGKSAIVKLLEKLKSYCEQPLTHWKTQRLESGNVLEIYNKFPAHSTFKHPKCVPSDVCWGRFRLGGTERLAGFVVPQNIAKENNLRFDQNTFYVVFLDKNHEFYPTKMKKK